MSDVLTLEMQKLIHPILQRENGFTMESVQNGLSNKTAKLFSNENSLLIVTLRNMPLASVANIWLGAGDLNGIKSLLPEVEEYAKEKGCSRLEFIGREGWKKCNCFRWKCYRLY